MKKIVIIGAGPAGLSAALSILENTDYKPIIIEKDSEIGGLSKTLKNGDFFTDIGPHRFFTKNDKVMNLWTSLLSVQGKSAIDDLILGRNFNENGANPETEDNVFLKRKRFSRIYYRKHFIDYPIKINPSIFIAMGLFKSIQAGFSYIKSCFFKLNETNLETFMINRFGRVLYELFFEGYTYKVWGIHPKMIQKEWGEQRIKKISLLGILINAIKSAIHLNKEKETSLIDEYFYPKFGSSQMWESMANRIIELGGKIMLNTQVIGINNDNSKITSIKILDKISRNEDIIDVTNVISSMPIKDLIINMENVPSNISEIASNLPYRDFILVNFVTKNLNLKNNTKHKTINNIAPDSWIYLQDSDITAGRMDIMNNFSPYFVKDFKNNIVINLEYFCNENDEFWTKSDVEIIEFAQQELLKINALDKNDIKLSRVFRITKAYPSYFGSYENFDKIKDFINSIENLYPIGRNGQHKYNNMDHSILSGIIVADILKNNSEKKNIWNINTEQNYQE